MMQSIKIGTSRVVYPNMKPKIGLEVHAQLILKSKLFSQGSNANIALPNSQLDYLDIALPGTLPKLNYDALQSGILSCLGLNCSIKKTIHFDRKNYFYTDMPAGYQITQYNSPLATDGHLEFIVESYYRPRAAHTQNYDLVKYLRLDQPTNVMEPYIRRSTIKQIQLEQDSAKSLHEIKNACDDVGTKFSLVDFNRSGAALIEIVFEPDLQNHHEATSLVRELICTLKTIDTCHCELQEGSLRVDANISIQELDGRPIQNCPRVELKNLNSLKSLNFGIAHEIYRQADIIRSGKNVAQESRTFDTRLGKSIILREKESSVDYRYVPEPSLPPLVIDDELIESLKRQTAKMIMPKDKRDYLIEKFALDLHLVIDMLDEPGLYEYFLEVINGKTESYNANVVADFLIYTVTNLKDIKNIPHEMSLDANGIFMQRLPADKMKMIIDLFHEDRISYMTAYEIIKHIYLNNVQTNPEEIVEKFNWYLIDDDKFIEQACDSLIRGMKNISKKYRKTGETRFLKMMLAKISELHDDRISIKKVIKILDNKLRSPRESADAAGSDNKSVTK